MKDEVGISGVITWYCTASRTCQSANLSLVVYMRIVKRLHLNNLATLMDVGCKKIREGYITECVEEDYIALSLIHELRGLLGRSHIINGFNIQEIEFLLDFICTQ